MNRICLAVALALGWAALASADDWGEVAQISTTLGVQADRLCLGEGSRGDIGCPSYAPYVSPTYGWLGIGTTDPQAPLEISTSVLHGSVGPLAVFRRGTLNSAPIQFTNTLDTWYIGTRGSSGGFALTRTTFTSENALPFYIDMNKRAGFSVSAPSTTLHVSGTVRIANGGEACDANRAGALRWHAEAGQFQVCYGSGGWALLSSAATSGSTVDRIVSGSAVQAIANNSELGGYISLTAGPAGNVWGYLGSSATYLPTVNAASITITGNLNVPGKANGTAYGTWTGWSAASPASVTTLLSTLGTQEGALYLSPALRNTVFALRENGSDDGFYFISGGGNYNSDENYDTNILALRADGRVAIGTSSPSTTLHVSGTARIANGGEACDADRAGAMRWHAGAGQFQVCYGSGGWALLSSAATSGSTVDRIVSGTSSVIAGENGTISLTSLGNDVLWISNSAVYVKTGVGGRTVVGTPAGYNGITFYDNALARRADIARPSTGLGFNVRSDTLSDINYELFIKEGGNVGIGTTSPSKTLTVNGDADVSGTVKVAGTGAESCTMGTLGQIRLNPTSGKFEVCRQ